MSDKSQERKKVMVLNVVGLTPRLLEYMPNVRSIGKEGFSSELQTVFPAVTCSVQSTLLTGLMPNEHGIVGNGWYFRGLGEVLLWRQSAALVQGERVWQTARQHVPDYTATNVCWWYAMGTDADFTVTPRPIYHADGRKSPDCYTIPPRLHDELSMRFGEFPLFSYWGPRADITSSRWIAQASQYLLGKANSDLTLAYIPHLDYDLQRFGSQGPEAIAAAREVDTVLGPLITEARSRDITVVVVSEYGITDVSRPIDINRALRREGLLSVYTQAGMEYLDSGVSRAFAVADHQAAHVYIRDSADIEQVRQILKRLPGVDEVLDRQAQAAYGIDHERSGELVVIAEPDAWFTYYYWLDDNRAPDFARNVDIHRKPGYDPAELFLNPDDRLVKLRAAGALAKKKLGFRYTIPVVPLDPSCVRGSHGRLPDDPQDGPVLLCSDANEGREKYLATEVKDLLLRLSQLPITSL